MSGKWEQPGVPHKGWTCIGVEDLETLDAVCEMCETREIRYVHYMEHPNYPGTLGVGCVCAENMESDYERPRKRERILKNANRRRRNWLSRNWRTSSKGNQYLNTDGMNITVFRKDLGGWGARIIDRHNDRNHLVSKRNYTTEEAVKLAAFDKMVFLKNEHGWGS